jgi:signal peptidase I
MFFALIVLRQFRTFLSSNELNTDFKRAHLGFFDCNLSKKNVEAIKFDFPLTFIRKKSIEPDVRLRKSTFGRELYWNYDNLGSLIVPQKGMRIKLGNKSYLLYKDIIEEESGDELKKVENTFFLGGNKTDIYTFKHDYVFLVNDNRSNLHDSRTFGLIAKDKLMGTFLFKLPW